MLYRVLLWVITCCYVFLRVTCYSTYYNMLGHVTACYRPLPCYHELSHITACIITCYHVIPWCHVTMAYHVIAPSIMCYRVLPCYSPRYITYNHVLLHVIICYHQLSRYAAYYHALARYRTLPHYITLYHL